MNNEEKLLFKGPSSPRSLALTFVSLGLVGLAVVVLAFILTPWLLVALLAPAGIAGWFLLLLKSRIYEITTERIRVSTGLVTRRTDELELYRVKDMTLVEPPMQRFFKLGNIVVQTSDTTNPTLVIEAVENPAALRESLRTAVEACRARNRVRLTELE